MRLESITEIDRAATPMPRYSKRVKLAIENIDSVQVIMKKVGALLNTPRLCSWHEKWGQTFRMLT